MRNGILNFLQSPQLGGMAQGLLQASGPSQTPIGWGPALAQGMQIGNQLQQQQLQQKAMQQKQALANLMAQSKIPLMQAQAKMDEQRALGNIGVTGVAGQLKAADALEASGHPDEANTIRNAVNTQMKYMQQHGDYLGTNLWAKGQPNVIKEQLESQTGILPGNAMVNPQGNIAIPSQQSSLGGGQLDQSPNTMQSYQASAQSPVAQMATGSEAPQGEAAAPTVIPIDQGAIKGVAGNAALKSSVPGSVLQKNLYATNIEKTFSMLDPSIISSFSGPEGQTYLKKELTKTTLNPSYSPPKDVQEYLNFSKVQAPILTGQINQFYGGSVQPSAVEELKSAIVPDKWISNPQTALASFNALKSIMDSEIKTYRGAVQNPDVYSGVGQYAQLGQPATAPTIASPSNGQKPLKFNTKTGQFDAGS